MSEQTDVRSSKSTDILDTPPKPKGKVLTKAKTPTSKSKQIPISPSQKIPQTKGAPTVPRPASGKQKAKAMNVASSRIPRLSAPKQDAGPAQSKRPDTSRSLSTPRSTTSSSQKPKTETVIRPKTVSKGQAYPRAPKSKSQTPEVHSRVSQPKRVQSAKPKTPQPAKQRSVPPAKVTSLTPSHPLTRSNTQPSQPDSQQIPPLSRSKPPAKSHSSSRSSSAAPHSRTSPMSASFDAKLTGVRSSQTQRSSSASVRSRKSLDDAKLFSPATKRVVARHMESSKTKTNTSPTTTRVRSSSAQPLKGRSVESQKKTTALNPSFKLLTPETVKVLEKKPFKIGNETFIIKMLVDKEINKDEIARSIDVTKTTQKPSPRKLARAQNELSSRPPWNPNTSKPPRPPPEAEFVPPMETESYNSAFIRDDDSYAWLSDLDSSEDERSSKASNKSKGSGATPKDNFEQGRKDTPSPKPKTSKIDNLRPAGLSGTQSIHSNISFTVAQTQFQTPENLTPTSSKSHTSQTNSPTAVPVWYDIERKGNKIGSENTGKRDEVSGLGHTDIRPMSTRSVGSPRSQSFGTNQPNSPGGTPRSNVIQTLENTETSTIHSAISKTIQDLSLLDKNLERAGISPDSSLRRSINHSLIAARDQEQCVVESFAVKSGVMDEVLESEKSKKSFDPSATGKPRDENRDELIKKLDRERKIKEIENQTLEKRKLREKQPHVRIDPYNEDELMTEEELKDEVRRKRKRDSREGSLISAQHSRYRLMELPYDDQEQAELTVTIPGLDNEVEDDQARRGKKAKESAYGKYRHIEAARKVEMEYEEEDDNVKVVTVDSHFYNDLMLRSPANEVDFTHPPRPASFEEKVNSRPVSMSPTRHSTLTVLKEEDDGIQIEGLAFASPFLLASPLSRQGSKSSGHFELIDENDDDITASLEHSETKPGRPSPGIKGETGEFIEVTFAVPADTTIMKKEERKEEDEGKEKKEENGEGLKSEEEMKEESGEERKPVEEEQVHREQEGEKSDESSAQPSASSDNNETEPKQDTADQNHSQQPQNDPNTQTEPSDSATSTDSNINTSTPPDSSEPASTNPEPSSHSPTRPQLSITTDDEQKEPKPSQAPPSPVRQESIYPAPSFSQNGYFYSSSTRIPIPGSVSFDQGTHKVVDMSNIDRTPSLVSPSSIRGDGRPTPFNANPHVIQPKS
ncbi:hypothetical protein BLNAU_4156 [Blattamonas nauphoetae]|uniref:Uncharacterized protein n=1 Tax=Blattamonas nauphoetae TaxID=2049346 RepID=A0ABQ9YAM6_9EUKA|nr:hypothetical protein BLNAU_4156 [Blattamonas nauphoetae]